jgi:hypothetical protein
MGSSKNHKRSVYSGIPPVILSPEAERDNVWRWPGFGLPLIAIAAFLLGGCAQSTALTTGPFARTNRIDTELRRGVSTKSEVERILGKPNGTGGSLLPLQDRPREVWVYNQVQTGDPRVMGGRPMLVEVDTRQQIIVVFFEGDIFDGYLWSLHVTTGTGGAR